MMAGDQLDLAYRLLDFDLVDSEGRRCGKVDDLVLDGSPGEPTYVSEILAGPRARSGRLPRWVRRIRVRVFPGDSTRVPWAEVEKVSTAVELAKPAVELDLGGGDRAAARIVERFPGSGS